MFRLAAFDMDGTLLMPDHRLGEKTLSTLSQLAEKPMTLTFATGRHYLEMKDILSNLGLEGYLITGNGTRIHDLAGNRLHVSDLPAECAHELLNTHWNTPASLHVFLRDTAQVVSVALTFWLWLTPIFIAENQFPPWAHFVLISNPLYYLVRSYRTVLLTKGTPDPRDLAIAAAYGVVAFVLGGLFFRHMKRGFADVL